MENVSVEVIKNEGQETFDLTISMKGFNGNYFLFLEHMIFTQLEKGKEKGGELAQQTGFYNLPNTPLFDLREKLLAEVTEKIDNTWRKWMLSNNG